MPDSLGRRISGGTAHVVSELELLNADVVDTSELARLAGLESGSPRVAELVRSLVANHWLVPLPVRGTYEFIPARAAGPFSRSDILDPLRGLLKRRPSTKAQLALGAAAFLRGFTDRQPELVDVLVPRDHPLSDVLRRTYRTHRVAPNRIFGGEPIDGVLASTPERLLVDAALWPHLIGRSLRHRDHWLGQALERSNRDVAVGMLRSLGSPSATARAGYLADAFGRPDLSDEVALLGRSPVMVPLIPGLAGEPMRRDARFNVADPIGAASVR